MEKETGIDDLARMVANGFSSIERRLDGIEGVVRATNQRIDSAVMPELDDHARRIKDLEIRTT